MPLKSEERKLRNSRTLSRCCLPGCSALLRVPLIVRRKKTKGKLREKGIARESRPILRQFLPCLKMQSKYPPRTRLDEFRRNLLVTELAVVVSVAGWVISLKTARIPESKGRRSLAN